MRLFRYFDAAGGLATLMSKTMRFASPMVFNDPFELTPRIEKASDDLLLDRLMADHLIEDYFQKVGSKEGMTREQSAKVYFAEEVPKRFLKHQSHEYWSEKAKQLKLQLAENFSRGFRLLCCSHRDDSILMWSHYADKHRGIVLEIEVDELIPDLPLSNYAYDVRYRSSPPTISALHGDLESFDSAINLSLSTKAIEWSYEEEARIQLLAPEGLAPAEPYDQPIDPICIKRVIVGLSMSPKSNEYRTLDQLADHPDYRHSLFQRADIDLHDYKLRFFDRPRA
jgi:hypothetical protein